MDRIVKVGISHRPSRNNKPFVFWTINGRQFREMCQNEEDAEYRKHALFEQLNSGRYGNAKPVHRIPYAECKQQYLAYKRIRIALGTLRSIETILGHFEEICNPQTSADLNSDNLKLYLDRHKAAPNTLNTNLAHLKTFVYWAQEMNYVRGLLKVKKLKTKQKHVRVLTLAEIEKLKEAAAPYPEYLLRIKVQLATAQRINEISTLSINQLNFENNTITFVQKKTDERIVIPVKQSLMDELANHVSKMETGKSLLFKWWNNAIWRKIIKRAGLDGITTHVLKKTVVTMLMGQDISLAQCFSGNRDINVLMRHYVNATDKMRAAAETLPV